MSQAWQRVSAYAQKSGDYTIAAVRLDGELIYELWLKDSFIARANDAATLRQIAEQGGVA